MKKLIIILTVIFATMFASESYSQSNYATIGEGKTIPYCIWKVQVLDEFNDAPLSNARLEFFNYQDKMGTIRTNENGIAVVIVYDVAKIQNSWSLKITAANYSYNSWEKRIKQYDYYSGNEKKVLVLSGVDWGNKKAQPSERSIANLVSNGRYTSWNINEERRNYGVKIPLFEFNVRLQYQHHPKDNIYLNGGGSNNSNNETEKSFESSWAYNGKIHGSFEWVKGDITILVSPTGKYLEDRELYRAIVFNENQIIHYGELHLLPEAKIEAKKLRQKF